MHAMWKKIHGTWTLRTMYELDWNIIIANSIIRKLNETQDKQDWSLRKEMKWTHYINWKQTKQSKRWKTSP